jgi:hypothetical protein
MWFCGHFLFFSFSCNHIFLIQDFPMNDWFAVCLVLQLTKMYEMDS